MRVYSYKKCGTSRKAIQWLNERQIPHEVIEIREQPPARAELARAFADQGDNLRPLFNTSGQDYRALGISQKLPAMSVDEALDLLAGNGNLIKRPFVVGSDFTLVGFKPEEWANHFGKDA